uniref:RAD50-interacting protein 1 n=3 Tax=Steinernema glaseri TaxID=37863 RepID=A0A1I7Z5S3_9BILA
MDDSRGSDHFPLSPAKEFERQEHVHLRNQIASLNWKNLQEYFGGIRKIAAELDAKIMGYEEEIHFVRLNLPAKLKEVRKYKQELQEMRAQLVENVEIYGREREAILQKMEKDYPDILEKIKNIMEKRKQYCQLYFDRKLDDLCSDIEICLHAHDFLGLVKKHVQLVMLTRDETFLHCSEEEIAEFMETVDDKVSSLNQRLYKELTSAFNDITTQIKFPFEGSVDYSGYSEQLEKMSNILQCLHEIKQWSGDNGDRLTILEILFSLFEKRFKFHFYGENRPTNQPEKPEYFFTLVTTWLGANMPFFADYVQKIVDRTNSEVCVKGEFQKRLVNLAIGKVEYLLDSDDFVANWSLFSHIVDEALNFELDLNSFGYPQDFPRVFSLFCRTDILNAWLRMEREVTASAIDSLILNENAFKNRYREVSDVDTFLVPEFADSFITMMQSVLNRYKLLPDIHAQALFFKHQLMIFDEFRTRLVQILGQAESPWTEPFPQILNSLWYIAIVLNDWSSMSEFIHIQNYIDSGNRIRGAFDDSKNLYHHVWLQKVTALVNSFGQMIALEIEEYAKQKWFSVTTSKPSEVTPSMYSFLRKIRDLIGKITTSISDNSIKKIYEMTCRMVAIVIMDDVVKRTNFNGKGAAQMLYDVETCVVPLMHSLYTRPNRAYFDFTVEEPKWTELLNSLKLLALPAPTAILLKDEMGKIPEQMVEDRLNPLGIRSLTKEEVLGRFNQRCDLTIR